MLLATELVPSSQVSTRDVSYPSPSYNTPFDQYRNGSGVPFEPSKISVAMARFITVNDGQEAASMREHELIAQLLMRRCSISRTSVMTKCCDARERPALVDGGNNRSQEGKALIEARHQVQAGGVLSGIKGFCHTALRCAEGVVVVNVVFL